MQSGKAFVQLSLSLFWSHFHRTSRVSVLIPLMFLCPLPPQLRYAFALADFADDVICKHPSDPVRPVPARLWTSTLRRTRDTARHISSVPIMVDGYPWVQMKPRVWSNLDEIYAGACDGFTYPEVRNAVLDH